MKKILASLLALCLSLGILAGCGSSNTPAQSGGKKTFVFGDTTFNAENEEPTINPHEAYSGWACIRRISGWAALFSVSMTIWHFLPRFRAMQHTPMAAPTESMSAYL